VQRDRIGTWETSCLAVIVVCCVPSTTARIGKGEEPESAVEFELRRVWLENRGSIMVSRETLEKIMAVMKRHLTPSQVRVIVGELNEVSGDKSFRDTVRAMVAALEREEQQ
jgi:hypothetical protein